MYNGVRVYIQVLGVCWTKGSTKGSISLLSKTHPDTYKTP